MASLRPTLCAALVAALLAPIAAARGQRPDSAATRSAGDSAIVHKDWNALVAIYQPVVRANPDNGGAWFRLGAGLHEIQRYQEAAQAFRESLRLKFQPVQSELRLARAFARLRQYDSAVVHLTRAADAGALVEAITTEPDFRSLITDTKYTNLVQRLETARYPCRSNPQAHEFDFWIGDWVVTTWGGPPVTLGRPAENHITSELEHCIIHERWTSAAGGKGESINFWDPNRKAWRQIWMDENQWSLDYQGEFTDGAMRFQGWTLGPTGQKRLEKLTFFNIAPDTVRQLFEQSTDDGKTWRTTFDGRYVRMKPTNGNKRE